MAIAKKAPAKAKSAAPQVEQTSNVAAPAAVPAVTEMVAEKAAPVVDAAPTTQTIFEELAAATKNSGFVNFNPGEDVQKYLTALTLAVYTVPEAAWNALSTVAQTWYNEATAAMNCGGQIAVPQGLVVPDAPAAAATTEKAAPAPKAAAKTAVDTAAAKAAKAAEKEAAKAKKAADAAAAKAAKAPRERGITHIMREVVLDHQDWSIEQIRAQLVADGFSADVLKESTIGSVRTDMLITIKLIQRKGYWNSAPVID